MARKIGSTICSGQTWARKSHQDSAVRFVTAKSWPEKATKTRQYDLLWPRVGQKEPPRLGSTMCYGQTWARKSHQDSAVRFVTAKSWPERATKTRQYDLLRPGVDQKEPPYDLLQLQPKVGKKEPPRLGSTICYGQELARKSHQDSALRFVTAKSWPERATKTRQYDLLRPRVGQEEAPNQLLRPKVGQKEPPRLGSTICCGQTWARKSHQDSAVRFVTAKSWPEKSRQDSAVRFVTAKRGPERATETRQYDLLRPNLGQKEPPRLGSTICCGQTWARKSHRDSAVRFVTAKTWPERSAVRFVAAKHGTERATKTRQYDLLRPRVGQKKQPRLGSTICYGQELARKSRRDSAVRCVTAKRGPERATKTRHYDLLRPRVGQKEPPRPGSTICYGQEWARKKHRTICYGQKLARKSHRDSAIRFVAAKRGPERAIKTRPYDLLRPRVGQKRAAKTRQYDLLRPNVGQKEPPRLRTWARKSHQDSAVRFVAAKRGPERATETRQYDLLRLRLGQKDRQYDL